MILYGVLIVIMIILNLIQTLNTTLSFTAIINTYSAESIDIIDKRIVNEEIISHGNLEDNFYRAISYKNEKPFKTLDIIKMDTKEKVNRQKRFAHYSGISYNSDITDISKRCLCPWKTKWHYDSRRTPKFVPKAICGNKCNFNFTNTKLSSLSDVLTSCEPFTRDVRVFKDNKEIYLMNWPVACLCTNKITSVILKPSKTKTKTQGNIRRRGCSSAQESKIRMEKRKRRRKRPKRRRKKYTCRNKKRRMKRKSRLFNTFRHRIF